MTDSEILTIAVIAQWRVGVPWQSLRGAIRYIQSSGRCWFPNMVNLSWFYVRMKRVEDYMTPLMDWLSTQLPPPIDGYERVDTMPLPAFSKQQARVTNHHWLPTARIGRCSEGWFWGHRWLVSVRQDGFISGMVVESANINDRWFMQAFVSGRNGHWELEHPPFRKRSGKKGWIKCPTDFIGWNETVGKPMISHYIADKNFNGQRWDLHWQHHYQAVVITQPPHNQVPQLSAQMGI